MVPEDQSAAAATLAAAAPPSVGAEVEEVRLSREMTLFDATMLGVGALMGGGVFVLVGLAAQEAGPAVLLAFALNALITLPTLLVYAELGSAFDDAGGGYLWVKDALRQPWGFLGGWIGWFSHIVACAVYALASAAYVVFFLNLAGAPLPLPEGILLKILAAALTLAFVGLNYVGVKSSVKTENTITVLVLGIILAFVGFGLRAMWGQGAESVRENFVDFFPKGIGGLAVAMGLTFIAFEGYEIIAQSSEEVKDPKRNIPRAIKLSLLIVAPLYLLVTFVALGALHVPGFDQSWRFLGANSEVALVRAASEFMPYGAVVVLGGALLTNITALNATIYSSSRVSFAMGRDGNLPKPFGRIHPARRTPHVSIWASGAVIAATVLSLPIVSVAAAADVMFLLLFLLVIVSYVKLRHTVPPERFGYRAPLFPFLPIFGMIALAFLAVVLLRHNAQAAMSTLGVVVAGLGFYYVYARPREQSAAQAAAEQTIVHEKAHSERRDYRVLVPVANPANAEALARLAARIASGRGGEILLLYVVSVPRTTLPSEGRAFVAEALPVLRRAEEIVASVAPAVPVHAIVRIGHSVPQIVRDTAEEKGATLLLLGWRGVGRVREFLLGSTIGELIEDPPCDLAVLKIRETRPKFERLFIPTHGGAHAPLSIGLGTSIGRSGDAPVTVFNAVTPGDAPELSMDGRRARGRGLLAAYGTPGAKTTLEIEPAEDVVKAVATRAKGADLVIVGASTEPVWRNYLFGHKTEQLAERIESNVLMVKAHQGATASTFRALGKGLRGWARYLRRHGGR